MTDADTGHGLAAERAAERRDQDARQRDLAAQRRDGSGEQRDEVADLRDEVAVARALDEDQPDTADPVTVRNDAWHDRVAGARDRVQAAGDRAAAFADRQAAARDRRHAAVDGLTGVYTREAGLIEIERDVARAGRTGHPLVLAFVDVDRLKLVNDTLGHAAGDRLLQQVATTLAAALRPYDLVIRYGGDEFLCAIEGVDATTARPRLARVNNLLRQAVGGGSVSVGLAEFQPPETAGDLIARADADLYLQRQRRIG